MLASSRRRQRSSPSHRLADRASGTVTVTLAPPAAALALAVQPRLELDGASLSASEDLSTRIDSGNTKCYLRSGSGAPSTTVRVLKLGGSQLEVGPGGASAYLASACNAPPERLFAERIEIAGLPCSQARAMGIVSPRVAPARQLAPSLPLHVASRFLPREPQAICLAPRVPSRKTAC